MDEAMMNYKGSYEKTKEEDEALRSKAVTYTKFEEL